MTEEEHAQQQDRELKIRTAGKEVAERVLEIGELISDTYQNAGFRGTDGGRSFEQWCGEVLPELLPGEIVGSVGIQWADRRRFLFVVRKLLSSLEGGLLPETQKQAEALRALVPRESENLSGYNPVDFDGPIDGLKAVWKEANKLAKIKGRRNGSPTEKDVLTARDQLRPRLIENGWMRGQPSEFASDRERFEAAGGRVIDLPGDTRPEPKNTPSAPSEKELTLQQEVRTYNHLLLEAEESISKLGTYYKGLQSRHGSKLLDEMRMCKSTGLIHVRDDLKRLTRMAQELSDIGQLANSSDEPTALDIETIIASVKHD